MDKNSHQKRNIFSKRFFNQRHLRTGFASRGLVLPSLKCAIWLRTSFPVFFQKNLKNSRLSVLTPQFVLKFLVYSFCCPQFVAALCVMSFRNKNYSSSNGGNRNNPFRTGNSKPLHSSSEAVGSENKNFDSTSTSPPRQNKTPNKSGLTPIRPTKSPGNGARQKSGLTPIRPVTHSQGGSSKSPGSGLKLKSGLTPVRPEASQTKGSFSHKPKLKCGLLPIKPSN